jgi:hypothetical protein
MCYGRRAFASSAAIRHNGDSACGEVLMRALTVLLFTMLAAPSLGFDLEGHRGARGLAPENTLTAFRKALEIGVTEIETSCLTIETQNDDTVSQAPDGGASPWHAGLALRDYGGSLPALVKAAGCGTWSMFWRNLTPKDVAEAHQLGLKVLPWTVNERDDMSGLIDLGVDGIIADYPDRLREVMAGKKMALP